MCPKPQPSDLLKPIAELHMEFRTYSDTAAALVQTTAWAGCTAYRALLENA